MHQTQSSRYLDRFFVWKICTTPVWRLLVTPFAAPSIREQGTHYMLEMKNRSNQNFSRLKRGEGANLICGHPSLDEAIQTNLGYYIYVASKLRFYAPGPMANPRDIILERLLSTLTMRCLPLNITNRYFIFEGVSSSVQRPGAGSIDRVYRGSPLLGHPAGVHELGVSVSWVWW
jgi:hypothetical protein